MKNRIHFIAPFVLVVFSLALFGASSARSGVGIPPTQVNQNTQISVPAPSSAETLRVFEGKSLVLNTGDPIKRVSVTNDEIVAAIMITPTQLLLHGLESGIVTLIMWNEQEQLRSFDLHVQKIPMNLDSLRATISTALPDQDISVSQSGSSLVLTGTVISEATVERAEALAKTHSEDVVNLLQIPAVTDTVLLEVKFAEVQRNASQQLGINIFSQFFILLQFI